MHVRVAQAALGNAAHMQRWLTACPLDVMRDSHEWPAHAARCRLTADASRLTAGSCHVCGRARTVTVQGAVAIELCASRKECGRASERTSSTVRTVGSMPAWSRSRASVSAADASDTEPTADVAVAMCAAFCDADQSFLKWTGARGVLLNAQRVPLWDQGEQTPVVVRYVNGAHRSE